MMWNRSWRPFWFALLALVGILTSMWGCAGSNTSTKLDSRIVSTVDRSIYEVLIVKYDDKNVTYEKALPYDLLPYHIRNDKYYSLGTAFCIGKNLFVSAAHVFNLEYESRNSDFFLRDTKGQVFRVDKVLKYSSDRDFIVFTLAGAGTSYPLPLNTSVRVHEPVYAVGNAYGEGIVIRDGLYTSATKEARQGKWEWIRFSAPASPGNSGGPLLDQSGRVIGVVLRKSENENLNYALPIKEVLAFKDNTAVLEADYLWRIDMLIGKSKRHQVKKTFSLPKTCAELRQAMVAFHTKNMRQVARDMLDEEGKNLFPLGEKSKEVLYHHYFSRFPILTMLTEDGKWKLRQPEDISKAELGHEGFFEYGVISQTAYMLLARPENIPAAKFYTDSKLVMDLLLQGLNITRNVGGQEIKLMSLGKAEQEYVHTDAYKRKWIARAWSLSYSDQKIISLALPVPEGYAIMLRRADVGGIGGEMVDLEVLADFVYLTYYGTFAQWSDFLKNAKHLPEVFSTLQVKYEPGKTFRFTSKRLDFGYSSSLMNITPDSVLHVGFGFFQDQKKVVWDVHSVATVEDKDKDTFVNFVRHPKPLPGMEKSFQKEWKDLLTQSHPYNKKRYAEDSMTYIATVAHNKRKGNLKSQEIIYQAIYAHEGDQNQAFMESKLDAFLKGFTVRE